MASPHVAGAVALLLEDYPMTRLLKSKRDFWLTLQTTLSAALVVARPTSSFIQLRTVL